MERITQAIVPACVTFGPVFMVIDHTGPYRWVGALMLALGIAWMYRTVILLNRELRRLRAGQADRVG